MQNNTNSQRENIDTLEEPDGKGVRDTHSCFIPCSLFAKIARNVDTFVEPRLSVIQHRRDAATRYIGSNTLFLHLYALVLPKSHIIYTSSGFLSFSLPNKRIVFTRHNTETSLALSQTRGREDQRESRTMMNARR